MPKIRIPPATLGKICENRVLELLTVLFGLCSYIPESDNEGTDKIVKRRHLEGVLKLQVKGRTVLRKGGGLELSVEEKELPAADPKYIVLVQYIEATAELGKFIWIVPSEAFVRLASRSVGYYKTLFATSPTARDRWVDYRYNTKDLGWVVTALLEAQDRGERPTTRAQVKAAAAPTTRRP